MWPAMKTLTLKIDNALASAMEHSAKRERRLAVRSESAMLGAMKTVVTNLPSSLQRKAAGSSGEPAAPKDWRRSVGSLTDSVLARAADAEGRRIRRKQTKP